jgi:CheY-like chemotaxis protein
MRLLLADDSVTIQRVIELTFADEGIDVVSVGDGQQAIDRLGAERFDVVLADVGMPGVDGFAVATYVQSRPELATLPVVLLTGAFDAVDQERVAAVKAGGSRPRGAAGHRVGGLGRRLLRSARSRVCVADADARAPRRAAEDATACPRAAGTRSPRWGGRAGRSATADDGGAGWGFGERDTPRTVGPC